MKSQRGVSAISLMITIVIMLMIIAYSVYFSRDTVVEGNLSKIYAEITQVQQIAKELSINSEYLNEISGEKFMLNNIRDMNPRVGGKLREEKKYFYFRYADPEITEVEIQDFNEILGVRNITKSYIIAINGVNEVEVYLVDGIEIDGQKYYTYDEIRRIYAEIVQK